MNKETYRIFFRKNQKYLKYSSILEELNIPRANFSKFMNNKYDYAISIEKLEAIKNRIKEIAKELINED